MNRPATRQQKCALPNRTRMATCIEAIDQISGIAKTGLLVAVISR
jgi:hypothetical protein